MMTLAALGLPKASEHWLLTKDGDAAGVLLYSRHYCARKYADGRRPLLFCGPGEKLVLITPDGRALFVWRKFIDASGQQGVNCAVFRNESAALSSALIREAEAIAWRRWPGARFYTFIHPDKVRSTNPGFCFLCAGWQKVGRTKGGHILLEKKP